MAIRVEKDYIGEPYYVGRYAYGSNHIKKEGSDELLVVCEIMQIAVKYKLSPNGSVVVTGSVTIPFIGQMVFYQDDTAVRALNNQQKIDLFADLIDLYRYFYK